MSTLDSRLVLAFEDELEPARALAAALGFPLQIVSRHAFPDGEWRITLPVPMAPDVVLYRSLHDPNPRLVELMIVAGAARAQGAKRLTLVAPYLAYMRQDMEFHPGEAVSQKIVGAFLAERFDAVVTVDPHLHRITSLDEAIVGRQTAVVSAAPLLAAHIAQQRPQAVLLGPDAESEQWIAQAAQSQGLEGVVCTKDRSGDRQVKVHLPAFDWYDRDVVILDDMASTGRTVAEAALQLRAAGARRVDLAVTHALFGGDALAVVRAAGVGDVWSTDAVPHASNVVPLAAALAQAINQLQD